MAWRQEPTVSRIHHFRHCQQVYRCILSLFLMMGEPPLEARDKADNSLIFYADRPNDSNQTWLIATPHLARPYCSGLCSSECYYHAKSSSTNLRLHPLNSRRKTNSNSTPLPLGSRTERPFRGILPYIHQNGPSSRVPIPPNAAIFIPTGRATCHVCVAPREYALTWQVVPCILWRYDDIQVVSCILKSRFEGIKPTSSSSTPIVHRHS